MANLPVGQEVPRTLGRRKQELSCCPQISNSIAFLNSEFRCWLFCSPGVQQGRRK